jgi:hypothetical protein
MDRLSQVPPDRAGGGWRRCGGMLKARFTLPEPAAFRVADTTRAEGTLPTTPYGANFRIPDHSDVEENSPLFLLKPRRELKPTTRERVVFLGGNDCALMIENAPALRRSLPNGRATGYTLNLPQRVS